MTSRGWFNFEATPTTASESETPFFKGDPSFRSHRLTPRKRIIWFAGLYVLGMTLSIVGISVVGPPISSVIYTAGVISSLLGTGFLIKVQTKQFTEQKKLMFKPVRITAATLFLVSTLINIIMTSLEPVIAVWIIFLVLSYLALLFYSLSYISSVYAGLLKNFKAT